MRGRPDRWGKEQRLPRKPQFPAPTWCGEKCLENWQRGEVRTGEDCARLGLRADVIRSLVRRGLLVRVPTRERVGGRDWVWRRPYVDLGPTDP